MFSGHCERRAAIACLRSSALCMPAERCLSVQALKLGDINLPLTLFKASLCASLVLSHSDGNMLLSYVTILNGRSHSRKRASISAKPGPRLAHSWLNVHFMMYRLLITE